MAPSVSPGAEDGAKEPAATETTPAEPYRESVRAERVEIRQGGAARIEAQSVSLFQGGASRVSASDVSITQGGAAMVRTGVLRLESGASAMAVAANRAELRDGSRVMILLARQVNGSVRPIIDWRGALALVTGFLVVRRLLAAARRR